MKQNKSPINQKFERNYKLDHMMKVGQPDIFISWQRMAICRKFAENCTMYFSTQSILKLVWFWTYSKFAKTTDGSIKSPTVSTKAN